MSRTQTIIDELILSSDRLGAYRRELAGMPHSRAACEMLARAERLIDDAVEAIPYAENR